MAANIRIIGAAAGVIVATIITAHMTTSAPTIQPQASLAGRTARLFLFEIEDNEDARAIGAAALRQASYELELASDHASWGFVRSRLTSADAKRFERRLTHRAPARGLRRRSTSRTGNRSSSSC